MAENEAKLKRMTEQLKLTNSNEDVANYIRWIITSDIAKKHWESVLLKKEN